MDKFKDKVVLITGGNRNTGLWLVKKFVDPSKSALRAIRNRNYAGQTPREGCE